MSLPVSIEEVRRRKEQLTGFMTENNLSAEDVVQLLATTIRPVSIRTVKAWIADSELSSARNPPLMLVDELASRLAATDTAKSA